MNSTALALTDSTNGRVRLFSLTQNTYSTFAGNGIQSTVNAVGLLASFASPYGITLDAAGAALWVTQFSGSYALRRIDMKNLSVTTVATFPSNLDGVVQVGGGFVIVSPPGNKIFSYNGSITVLAGNGTAGFRDGIVGADVMFNNPRASVFEEQTSSLILLDKNNACFRRVFLNGTTVTYAGVCGATGMVADGPSSSARFGTGMYNFAGSLDNYFALDSGFLRQVTSIFVRTIAGNGPGGGYVDGWAFAADFGSGGALWVDVAGAVYIFGFYSQKVTCSPCPASFYCVSGAPILCPAGSYCPLSSINATLCSAGTFAPSTGSTSCQQCPGGHYCPAGTSSWARLNCGRGNYCPDGSGAPTPCPYQVPPSGGWGALQVQGPAFLVETARCLNHCFWNFTSGDGMLSKC